MKKRKDGRYCRKVTLSDGTSKYFYSSAPSERLAGRDINKQVLNYEEEEHRNKHNFKCIAKKALEKQDEYIGNITSESYDHTLKHLNLFFDLDIEDITPAMLQELLDDLAKKSYSYSLISKTKIVFGIIQNYAIVHEKLDIPNYMRSIKIPKSAKKGKVSAPDDEIIKAITQNAEAVNFGMWAMMELCTGLRRGEINALKKSDIDFKNRIINITRSVEFIGNNPHVKDRPKTENSIRYIPIIDVLYEPLKKMCLHIPKNNYIFGGENPCTLCAIRRRWAKYCKTIGYEFNQHQLRHAYAKNLYRAGIDPKTMQHLLGHADFKTTMNIYTDFANEVTTEKVVKLNEYMSKKF